MIRFERPAVRRRKQHDVVCRSSRARSRHRDHAIPGSCSDKAYRTTSPAGSFASRSTGRNRRLAEDFEDLAETLATFVAFASIQLALGRLARAYVVNSTDHEFPMHDDQGWQIGLRRDLRRNAWQRRECADSRLSATRLVRGGSNRRRSYVNLTAEGSSWRGGAICYV